MEAGKQSGMCYCEDQMPMREGKFLLSDSVLYPLRVKVLETGLKSCLKLTAGSQVNK